MKREIKHYGGSRLHVAFRRDEKDARPVWAGHYRVRTKGRTSEEIAAEILRIEDQHQKKVGRLRGFAAMVATPLHAAGPLEWRTCTIRPRGTDVELVVTVRDSSGRRHRLCEIYRTVDDVPSDAVIAEKVVAMVQAVQEEESAEESKLAEVQAILDAG
jgi:hypothetical protein